MQEREKKSKKKHAHARLRGQSGRADSRVRIAIVGAGRLGTALGCALDRARHRVEVVVSRHANSARKAGRLVGRGVLPLTSSQLERLTGKQLERLSRCDLIVIATPDDAIGLAATQLSALFKGQSRQSARVALHTSGALSSEILGPLRNVGFATGSLHPLVSISDPVPGSELLRHAFFCVEGDRVAVRRARSIVDNLGGQSFTIDARKKALYHAAALTSSGHVVALFDIALEMLTHCGLSPQRARQILMPLVKSTVANLVTASPARALTGTFSRGDATTAANHLSAIRSENLRDALSAYALLGKRSIRLAHSAGVKDSDLEKLDRLIAKASRLL